MNSTQTDPDNLYGETPYIHNKTSYWKRVNKLLEQLAVKPRRSKVASWLRHEITNGYSKNRIYKAGKETT